MGEPLAGLERHLETARRFQQNLERVIVGRPETLTLSLVALLSRGHLLIEDVPGVGKTTLAKAIARSISGQFRRCQFTSDLLPMDLTGSSIFNQKTQQFEFKEGPIFTNILLADEINRATPRTQSALLECMEESQVSVDGQTYALPQVFQVIGTLNPIEQSGTFDLPETQLDRFLLRISLGYPEAHEEVRIFDLQARAHPLETLEAVVTLEEIETLRKAVLDIHLEHSVKEYAAGVVRATRTHEDVTLGASPRGTLHLLRAAQARALLSGRTFVLPDLIKSLAPAVLAHRILLKPQALMRGVSGEDVVDWALAQVRVPVGQA